MRKLFLSMWVIFSLGICQAQEVSSSGMNTDSFGDIAALSQKIALSERKIQALQLQNNLASLEEQQLSGHFPFKVQYIEGFNDVLYAVLVDDNGTLYHVEPGEIFADHYRVSLLRPTAVGVDDLSAHRFYTVPFLLGAMGATMMGELDNPVEATASTNSTSKTSAASQHA